MISLRSRGARSKGGNNKKKELEYYAPVYDSITMSRLLDIVNQLHKYIKIKYDNNRNIDIEVSSKIYKDYKGPSIKICTIKKMDS